jgi:molybdopterin synthase sulfur carrier subunit
MKVTALFAAIENRYPGIKAKVLDTAAVTVNLDYVDLEEESSKEREHVLAIKDGDEVAIIPPVSSG